MYIFERLSLLLAGRKLNMFFSFLYLSEGEAGVRLRRDEAERVAEEGD